MKNKNTYSTSSRQAIHATRYTLHEKGFTLSKARGFTLIEFLVVLSIIIFIVPSVFGLIYSLFRVQSRIIALQEVKRQGDLAYNHIKVALFNNAVSTFSGSLASPTPICTTAGSSSTGSSMYFLDTNGLNNYFGYKLNGTTLSYEKTSTTATPLTNSSVTISNFIMGCTKSSDFSPPLVNVSYKVTYPAYNVSLNYKTFIKLNTH